MSTSAPDATDLCSQASALLHVLQEVLQSQDLQNFRGSASLGYVPATLRV